MRLAIKAAKNHFKDKKVVCAEIGSWLGDNAVDMLDNWNEISKLYLIDSFEVCPDFRDADIQVSNKNRFVERFKDNQRTSIILDQSVTASKQFDNESLDFVYIDANHTYDAIKQDIDVWTPKVKKGGIIGGHDYEYKPLDSDIRTVKKAVDEYFGKESVKVGIVVKRVDLENFVMEISCDWWVYL